MTWLPGAICCRASVTRNPPASQSRISTSSTGLSSRASDAHWSAAAAALNPRDATAGARSVALALPSSSEDTVQCMGVVIYILLGRAGAAASTGGRDLRDIRVQLDSCVPVETALAPIGLTEIVGDFDRFDPFGVLVAKLGRSPQPQRIAERIADDLAGIFGGEDSLRMQRGRHVDAFGVIVGADEVDVFCGQIGADALQKFAQIRAGPLADIVPALNADVADDDLLLQQRIDVLRTPPPLVFDAAGQFEGPACAVDRFDVLDRIIGVETWRFFHLRRTESRRQMIGAEDRVLDAIIP